MNNSMCQLKMYETEKETAILIYYQVGRTILSFQNTFSSSDVGLVVVDSLFIVVAHIVFVGFVFGPCFALQYLVYFIVLLIVLLSSC